MTDARFDLLFRGEILENQQLEAVKTNIGKLFRLQGEKLESLFSGRQTMIKRNLDAGQAKKYKLLLAKAGAKVILKPVTGLLAGGLGADRNANSTVKKALTSVPRKAVNEIPKEAVVKPVMVKQVAKKVKVKKVATKKVATKKAVTKKSGAIIKDAVNTGTAENIWCPRCGNDQVFSTHCGHCKMDLRMEIKRIERKKSAMKRALARRAEANA